MKVAGGLVLTAMLAMPAVVVAQERVVGRWVTGTGQGIIEHSIYNDRQDRTFFVISDGSESPVSRVSIFLKIDGAGPAARQPVVIAIDGAAQTFATEPSGDIGTDCRSCADQFGRLWQRIRGGRSMAVSFGGRKAVFSLKGAAAALDAKAPVGDFYR